MTDTICKCCGQTLPPLGALDIPMSETQRKIMAAVVYAGKHGISTDRLFDSIWGGRRDGGPESGHKVLHVHICNINKILRLHGLKLSGEHTGTRYSYGRYLLRQIEKPKRKVRESDPYNLVESNWSTTPCR